MFKYNLKLGPCIWKRALATNIPPRNSLVPIVSPLQVSLHKVPAPALYFSFIVATAISLRHLHPNTLVTLGPPVTIAAWLANKKRKDYLYKKNIQCIFPDTSAAATNENNQILLEPYDETKVENVLNGIENEFEFFKSQLLPIIERKLVDYTILKNDPLGVFMENDQVSVKLSSNFDTFIVLPIKQDLIDYNRYLSDLMEEGDKSSLPQFEKFIKLSMPFERKQKRVATVEVYLLQHKQDPNRYNVAVEVTKFGLINRKSILIRDFERGGITSFKESKDKFIYL